MIKVSIEKPTLPELATALLEMAARLGTGTASELPSSPGAQPRQRKEKPGKDQPASSVESAASAPATAQEPLASTPPAGSASSEGKQPPAAQATGAPAPASSAVTDPEALRASIRAKLSELVRAGKQPQVNELVTSFAQSLSKVEAEDLPTLLEKAESL